MKPTRWNLWNTDHIAEHGVTPDEAEQVIRNAVRGYPRFQGDGRWLVRGQADAGRFLQAVFIYSPANVIYVIHARPLTNNEKRELRRNEKR